MSLNSKPTAMTTLAPALAAASRFCRCVVGSELSYVLATPPSASATRSVPILPSLRKSLTPIGLGETYTNSGFSSARPALTKRAAKGRASAAMRFMAFRPAGVKADKAGPRGHVRPGGTERGASLWSGFSATSFRKPPSIWRVTTVRADGLPPDDNCVVAYEEGDRPRDLDRLDVPGQLRTDQLRKDVARSLSGEVAIRDRDLTQHVGRHTPRANAIDVDVMRGERRGEDAGHIDERRLAGAVGQRLHMPLFTGLGSDVDDRTSRAGLVELRGLVGAEEIDSEDGLQVNPGGFEGDRVHDDRRTIHQTVERTEP